MLSFSIGCGCGKQTGDAEGDRVSQGAAPDPNAAVKPSFWGEERVTYAAGAKWLGGVPVPDGAQWDEAPAGVSYRKFTYYGERLIRFEGFDDAGNPDRIERDGVRREWVYASHGGVLEATLHEVDGTVTRREKLRYDDHERCKRRTLYDADGMRNSSEYTYSTDGLTRTCRMVLFGPDGSPAPEVTTVEVWNPETETWEPEFDE
jgi:hypothetical protein